MDVKKLDPETDLPKWWIRWEVGSCWMLPYAGFTVQKSTVIYSPVTVYIWPAVL